MKAYQLDIFYDYRPVAVSTDVVQEALRLLTHSIKQKPFALTSSQAVKDYCRLHLATREHEVFGVLFLDSQHRLIEYRELFRGTIDGCTIYVREVAKETLSLNAAAVIFTHNHPSGMCEPSKADINITKKLREALGRGNPPYLVLRAGSRHPAYFRQEGSQAPCLLLFTLNALRVGLQHRDARESRR